MSMIMLSFKSLLLATTALASTTSISARSAESELILADLVNLDASVNALHSAISNYTGGILDSSPILLDITGVHLANRKTYLDSLLIGNQTAADSEVILKYVSNPIAVDIPNTVEANKSKKGLFVAAGVQDTVLTSLDLLKYDHDSLSAALKAKIPKELLTQAMVPVKVIDDSIQSGIDDFSS